MILTDAFQYDLGKLSIVTTNPEKILNARVVGQLSVNELLLLATCEEQQKIILSFVN